VRRAGASAARALLIVGGKALAGQSSRQSHRIAILNLACDNALVAGRVEGERLARRPRCVISGAKTRRPEGLFGIDREPIRGLPPTALTRGPHGAEKCKTFPEKALGRFHFVPKHGLGTNPGTPGLCFAIYHGKQSFRKTRDQAELGHEEISCGPPPDSLSPERTRSVTAGGATPSRESKQLVVPQPCRDNIRSEPCSS